MVEKFASTGQEYIFIQSKDQYIIPILEMANVFRQTLGTAEVDIDDNFELIPREAIELIKALVYKGAEGKASAAELVLIGFITDAQQGLAGLADSSGVSTGEEEADSCTKVCFAGNSAPIPRQDEIFDEASIAPTNSCNEFCAMPVDVDSNFDVQHSPNENNLGSNAAL